jgi:hypothetical protein
LRHFAGVLSSIVLQILPAVEAKSKIDARNKSALITSTCAYSAMGFGKQFTQIFQIFQQVALEGQNSGSTMANSPTGRM